MRGNNLEALSDMGFYYESGIAKALALNDSWRGELRFLTKSNDSIWLDLSIIPILKEEQPTGKFLALALPITERKEAEQKQAKVLQLLEDITFKTSHKVRGPLTRIQGIVNLLEGDHLRMNELRVVSTILKDNALELDQATHDLAEFVDINYNSMNLQHEG